MLKTLKQVGKSSLLEYKNLQENQGSHGKIWVRRTEKHSLAPNDFGL